MAIERMFQQGLPIFSRLFPCNPPTSSNTFLSPRSVRFGRVPISRSYYVAWVPIGLAVSGLSRRWASYLSWGDNSEINIGITACSLLFAVVNGTIRGEGWTSGGGNQQAGDGRAEVDAAATVRNTRVWPFFFFNLIFFFVQINTAELRLYGGSSISKAGLMRTISETCYITANSILPI